MSETVQIPKGWELSTLDKICIKITDRDHTTPKYTKSGIPLISPKDFTPSGISFLNCKFISKEDHQKNCKRTDLKKGDILFSRIGTVGETRLIDSDKEFSILHSIVQIRPDLTKVSQKFLYYFLQSGELLKTAKIGIQSVGTPDLGIKKIRSFQIILPPPPTQKKIVQKLDDILGLLEEKKKEILELNIPEKLQALLELNKFSVLQLIRTGSLSANWRDFPKIKLGDLTKISSGGTPLRSNPEYWDGDIPWIKSGELLDDVNNGSEEYITKNGLSNSAAKLFPQDTILVALYGQGKTRGKTGRLLIEASTNQAICGIFPNSNFLSEYVQYWLRSIYWELRKTASGGAQPNWNSTTIKEIKIKLPPLNEQELIIKKLKKKISELQEYEKIILNIKEKKQQNMKYINHIQSSILDAAFSGKLVQ